MAEKASRTPKSVKAQITRASLVVAAAAILRSHGPGAVTYRRVAEWAGASSSSVGYYFESISQLLYEAAEHNMTLWGQRAEKAALDAEALTPEDWSETFSVYSEWASSSPAHVFRSASVQKEHIGMFLKYCGSGYLIRLNGSPVAYVLIENGKAVEAMFTRPDAFDGVTETLSLALPLALSEEGGYSMAKLLNLKSLFRLLPMRGVDSDARFGLSGKTYQLIINNGCFVSLTETSGKAYELTPAELIRTALGHGKEYPLSPIGSLFPEYGLAVFEKY